ncbi:MarR family protein [Streptomyces sp. YIM 130001]|uniref:MarR family winged helix-turn-helix transcriptional regulator n=1 Tax=Streptomyces sp. YIM 130001 TaxID=2259644 RepID=UPI000E651681|nr:MarR family transcriptional regulator [Streptomyces sp. YIM 130001]RII13116.1 MarR family protein [Streptomyces sp. YIM 130001]
MAKPEFDRMTAQHVRVIDGLRAYGANYAEFTRRFAEWLGLHSTDAVALTEILFAEDQGQPLSPARLRARIGLSSGATTILLNRLEQAGHVVRTREATDGRVVTLRSSPDIRPRAEEFFGPYSTRMTAEMARYTPERLQEFEDFVGHLTRAMDALLGDEYRPPGPGAGGSAG